MAVGHVLFACLTALVAVNLIFAEDSLLETGNFAYDQADGDSNYERAERSAGEENEKDEQQERTFFALFNYYSSSCNSTQGSSYCLSCTQAVRCYPSNSGIVRNCRGLLRYCNGGRCSLFPGSDCNSG